jgi:hypothetical protein
LEIETARVAVAVDNGMSSIRLKRAFVLALVFVSIVAAGVLPTCGDELCCANEEPAVHAQMPCCESTAITPRDVIRLQTVTASSTGVTVQAPPALAAVVQSAQPIATPRMHVQHPVASAILVEPTPPLFLLNAQFLI